MYNLGTINLDPDIGAHGEPKVPRRAHDDEDAQKCAHDDEDDGLGLRLLEIILNSIRK